jgi:hypothetical protein
MKKVKQNYLLIYSNYLPLHYVFWVKTSYYLWRAPKFLVRPTWGSKYVELRKVGTWGPFSTSNTKGGKRGVLEVLGLD